MRNIGTRGYSRPAGRREGRKEGIPGRDQLAREVSPLSYNQLTVCKAAVFVMCTLEEITTRFQARTTV